MVAVSVVWSWIFEPRVGILNFVLELFGLPGSQWTQSSETAMLSVLIVTVWKSIGWTMIFYMEAIRKVPQNLLEAAAIDGANSFWRFWKIIIPMISPTTFFLVIMSTISSFRHMTRSGADTGRTCRSYENSVVLLLSGGIS